MDSLKDSEQQISQIVSPSLILTPPANYNFRDYPGFDLGIDDEWMEFSPEVNDGNEWMELLGGIDFDELLEESPPKKKPYLCLSLKKKEGSTSRVFEDSTKPSLIDKQSRFVLPVTRSENETERVVESKKPHCDHFCHRQLRRKLLKCSKIRLTPGLTPLSSPDDLLYLYRKVNWKKLRLE